MGIPVKSSIPILIFFDHWNNAYKNCLRDEEHPFSNIDVIEKRYEAENMLINAVTSGRESQALEITSKFESWLLPQRISNNLRDMKKLYHHTEHITSKSSRTGWCTSDPY